MLPIPVTVSRRWLWPKRYHCDSITWCNPAKHDAPAGWVILLLTDKRRVILDARGRTITYGREAFDNEVERIAQETGQQPPMRRTA